MPKERVIALDLETTGLYPYQGDSFFALALWDCSGGVYLDKRKNLEQELDGFRILAHDPSIVWALANAKFDMAFLGNVGIFLRGRIHDVLVVDRLLDNDHLSYSLDSVAKRTLGVAKDSAVEEYIKEHKLFSGKGQDRKKHFDQVPLEIMEKYALKDVELTYKLALDQMSRLDKLDAECKELRRPSPYDVYLNECELTKTCFEMERRGIRIDEHYCNKAIEFEERRCHEAREKYTAITGRPFVDSRKELSQSIPDTQRRTGKGNVSYSRDSLKTLGEHPLSKIVQEHRDALKNKTTYFENFLRFSDSAGVLHASIKQHGTATGRMSGADPNLQNIPKGDEDEKENQEDQKNFKENEVRRAFIPRPGYCLVEIDYKAMEFRLLVNYANHISLASSIASGLDPHQATADMIGIKRKEAKTLNFGLLYGMGVSKLAGALKIKDKEAQALRDKYFEGLPEIKRIIGTVTRTAKTRGMVFNWMGRQYKFPDPKFAYKATNYVIQGGSADIVKVAMNRIAKLLANFKTSMLVQVHDSLVLEVHASELFIVEKIKEIMETVYQGILPLECDVSYSWSSWADMKAGLPVCQKSQKQSLESA